MHEGSTTLITIAPLPPAQAHQAQRCQVALAIRGEHGAVSVTITVLDGLDCDELDESGLTPLALASK